MWSRGALALARRSRCRSPTAFLCSQRSTSPTVRSSRRGRNQSASISPVRACSPLTAPTAGVCGKSGPRPARYRKDRSAKAPLIPVATACLGEGATTISPCFTACSGAGARPKSTGFAPTTMPRVLGTQLRTRSRHLPRQSDSMAIRSRITRRPRPEATGRGSTALAIRAWGTDGPPVAYLDEREGFGCVLSSGAMFRLDQPGTLARACSLLAVRNTPPLQRPSGVLEGDCPETATRVGGVDVMKDGDRFR
jgi:hypothetical protein